MPETPITPVVPAERPAMPDFTKFHARPVDEGKVRMGLDAEVSVDPKEILGAIKEKAGTIDGEDIEVKTETEQIMQEFRDSKLAREGKQLPVEVRLKIFENVLEHGYRSSLVEIAANLNGFKNLETALDEFGVNEYGGLVFGVPTGKALYAEHPGFWRASANAFQDFVQSKLKGGKGTGPKEAEGLKAEDEAKSKIEPAANSSDLKSEVKRILSEAGKGMLGGKFTGTRFEQQLKKDARRGIWMSLAGITLGTLIGGPAVPVALAIAGIGSGIASFTAGAIAEKLLIEKKIYENARKGELTPLQMYENSDAHQAAMDLALVGEIGSMVMQNVMDEVAARGIDLSEEQIKELKLKAVDYLVTMAETGSTDHIPAQLMEGINNPPGNMYGEIQDFRTKLKAARGKKKWIKIVAGFAGGAAADGVAQGFTDVIHHNVVEYCQHNSIHMVGDRLAGPFEHGGHDVEFINGGYHFRYEPGDLHIAGGEDINAHAVIDGSHVGNHFEHTSTGQQILNAMHLHHHVGGGGVPLSPEDEMLEFLSHNSHINPGYPDMSLYSNDVPVADLASIVAHQNGSGLPLAHEYIEKAQEFHCALYHSTLHRNPEGIAYGMAMLKAAILAIGIPAAEAIAVASESSKAGQNPRTGGLYAREAERIVRSLFTGNPTPKAKKIVTLPSPPAAKASPDSDTKDTKGTVANPDPTMQKPPEGVPNAEDPRQTRINEYENANRGDGGRSEILMPVKGVRDSVDGFDIPPNREAVVVALSGSPKSYVELESSVIAKLNAVKGGKPRILRVLVMLQPSVLEDCKVFDESKGGFTKISSEPQSIYKKLMENSKIKALLPLNEENSLAVLKTDPVGNLYGDRHTEPRLIKYMKDKVDFAKANKRNIRYVTDSL